MKFYQTVQIVLYTLHTHRWFTGPQLDFNPETIVERFEYLITSNAHGVYRVAW